MKWEQDVKRKKASVATYKGVELRMVASNDGYAVTSGNKEIGRATRKRDAINQAKDYVNSEHEKAKPAKTKKKGRSMKLRAELNKEGNLRFVGLGKTIPIADSDAKLRASSELETYFGVKPLFIETNSASC